jgi:4-hydroxy-3-methylbut-2-enyl diphosphate reductase
MEVYLAQPRGFCAGVVRAIEIVERALQKYGPPVYVRHEIVHNKYVVESLKNKGAIFVEDLSEVPPRAVTVFSAHGVARTVEEEAAARDLPVLNATCPLVTKVHNQGKRYMSKGPCPDPDRPCRSPRGRGNHGTGSRAGPIGAKR